MFLEYSISPHVPIGEYILSPSAVYVPKSLCSKSTVYVSKVQFMSLEYYLCP